MGSFVGLLTATSLMNCSGVNEKRPRQAILILLDASRPDRFSAYGYARETTPAIDKLAESGLIFTNFFSQGTKTRSALPSLIYSRYFVRPLFPDSPSISYSTPDDLFRTVDSEAASLPNAFAAAGFKTAAISAHMWVTDKTPFAQEFEEMYDIGSFVRREERYPYPRADEIVNRALEWITRNIDRDYFLYLHIMDTHFPHFFEEDAKQWFNAKGYEADGFHWTGRPNDRSEPLASRDREYLDALYDGSLRYTDRQLERLFDHLRRFGTLDQTLVAITADHGEALLERARLFEHGGAWFDLLARIPFILHYPAKVAPGTRNDLAEMVDIAPTILALMGVGLPPRMRMDGVDLMSARRGHREYVFSASGVRTKRHKLLFANNPPEDVIENRQQELNDAIIHLYDLKTDPLEASDVSRQHPEIVRNLAAAYRDRMWRPFRRYKGAVTNEQPQDSFAIASKHFLLYPAPLQSWPAKSLSGVQDQPAPTGWLRADHWHKFWLLGRADAVPLRIEFHIPNGEYALSLHMRGSCAIKIGATKQLREFEADPLNPADLLTTNAIEGGRITVVDEMFRATVIPRRGQSWLLIRMLGFQPIRSDVTSPDDLSEDDRIERLKSLGYIQ